MCNCMSYKQRGIVEVCCVSSWLGIRGTQVKSSIQDIVDEVALECDVTRLIRGL